MAQAIGALVDDLYNWPNVYERENGVLCYFLISLKLGFYDHVLGFKHIRATHKHSSWQMAYKNA
jgi:hypothetical protein